jgi:hypothetical protein
MMWTAFFSPIYHELKKLLCHIPHHHNILLKCTNANNLGLTSLKQWVKQILPLLTCISQDFGYSDVCTGWLIQHLLINYHESDTLFLC